MKKKKLNSKNPKYMDKSHITEVKTEKKLIREVKGAKIYAVKYFKFLIKKLRKYQKSN